MTLQLHFKLYPWHFCCILCCVLSWMHMTLQLHFELYTWCLSCFNHILHFMHDTLVSSITFCSVQNESYKLWIFPSSPNSILAWHWCDSYTGVFYGSDKRQLCLAWNIENSHWDGQNNDGSFLYQHSEMALFLLKLCQLQTSALYVGKPTNWFIYFVLKHVA